MDINYTDSNWIMVIITTILVIITSIYAITTIIICVFNYKSAKATHEQVEVTKNQIKEMINQYNAINRPIVTIRFEVIRSALLCFIVENEGPQPAHDVTITFNDSFIDNLPDEQTKNHLQKLKQAKLFLASHQKMIISLDGQPMFSEIAKEKAIVKITYDNFDELTEIDLNQYEMFLIDKSPLEDISQRIKKICEQNEHFHRALLQKIPANERIVNVITSNASEDDALKYQLDKQICMNPGCTIQSLCDLYPEKNEKIAELVAELQNFEGWIYCRPINGFDNKMSYGCFKK